MFVRMLQYCLGPPVCLGKLCFDLAVIHLPLANSDPIQIQPCLDPKAISELILVNYSTVMLTTRDYLWFSDDVLIRPVMFSQHTVYR